MTMPPMPSGSNNETPPEMPRWAQKRRSADQPTESVMEAFIGPKWDAVYRKKLSPFFDDPAFVPTWNWSAALLFPPTWFLYRKLYLAFAIFFIVPGLAFRLLTGSDTVLTMAAMQKPENEWLFMMNAAIFVSTVVAAGGSANWFLYRRARAAHRVISQQQVPPAEADRFLRRVGGTNRVATALFVAFSFVTALAAIGG